MNGNLGAMVWLDSIRADTVFGWRQLLKRKATSAAAILSLALATGACTAAFRLVDALLLRPLPVQNAERLYAISRQSAGRDGKARVYDGCEYPLFARMRAAVKSDAELIAVSYAGRVDLTYGSDQDMEKDYLQYVSGWMFHAFGLHPALGRLFTEDDDRKPGAHPYAVLSYDYWNRRFARDPKVIGRTFRTGAGVYEILGVAEQRFTGTEVGTMTAIFVPTMMHPAVERSDSTWLRTLVQLKLGAPSEPVRNKLYATLRAFQEERARGFVGMPKQFMNSFLNEVLLLEPAPTGVSAMQKENRLPLQALSVLVALVLLIACANVANLMTVQAAARAREMALRVSIGAGRGRLVQLVLVESAWLAFSAAALGALFAWWAAPLVVNMINTRDNPARLVLPADWRVFGFGLLLTLGVTFLFGILPALRASSVKPASALKGGDDPHSRRRLMHALIAVQVAFCFLVLFVGVLFVATFDRLSNQSTGFSAERILTLDTLSTPQSPAFWGQAAEHLRAVPGVEAVALAKWPLLSNQATNGFISINGAPPTETLAFFLGVSPGWLDIMKIPLIAGRDFRPGETAPNVAIVNETFAKIYLDGVNPLGRWFTRKGQHASTQIVGLTPDARYRSMREPILPVAYLPFRALNARDELGAVGQSTFIVRTASPNPVALASALRMEVPKAGAGFRVSNIHTQLELNLMHTVRERLLAMLALFFAVVALLLAGVGLYGVLDYSVLRRRREIGIRRAIGAGGGDIARRVTADVFAMVLAGGVAGLALGLASVRYIETLLYGVRVTDMMVLTLPCLAIVAAAMIAAVPAVIRAIRIDPVQMLRSE